MKHRVLETYFTAGNTIVVLEGNCYRDFEEGMDIEDENRVCHQVLSVEVELEPYIILPPEETTVILVNGFFQGRKVVIPGQRKFAFPSFTTFD